MLEVSCFSQKVHNSRYIGSLSAVLTVENLIWSCMASDRSDEMQSGYEETRPPPPTHRGALQVDGGGGDDDDDDDDGD